MWQLLLETARSRRTTGCLCHLGHAGRPSAIGVDPPFLGGPSFAAHYVSSAFPACPSTCAHLTPPLQAVRTMLKGSDATVLHALAHFGIPTTILRVWHVASEGRAAGDGCLR